MIERLIPNQDFHLQISDPSNNNAVLQTVLLNSGPPVTEPFPVPYPYTGCKPAVVFNDSSIPATSNDFLITGTTVDNSADYKTQTTTGIYAGRDTFAHWSAANGFGGAATETSAVYFNNADLKFGRSMHCRTVSHTGSPFTQDWIACYVSNFGKVGVDFSQQASNPLTDAYANTNVVATVAMEYHPDQTDKVQFWAFKGDTPPATAGDYFPNPALESKVTNPCPTSASAVTKVAMADPERLSTARFFCRSMSIYSSAMMEMHCKTPWAAARRVRLKPISVNSISLHCSPPTTAAV